MFQLLKKHHQNKIQEICESIKITKYNQLIETKKLEDIMINQRNQYTSFDNNIKQREAQLRHQYDCHICYERHFDIILVPCGHVLCHQCSPNATHCYFCRERIERKQKIFLN